MESYFLWLMELVDCPEEFSKLLRKLFSREFTSRIYMDQNRINDGLALRRTYTADTGVEIGNEALVKPCSVLEMMVALACRIEDDIMFDPELGDRTPMWFWVMIDNLNLDGMSNDRFDAQNVDQILNVLIDRTYFMNGTGGLFPLKQPKVNQRRVEIWYQMNAFLLENYE